MPVDLHKGLRCLVCIDPDPHLEFGSLFPRLLHPADHGLVRVDPLRFLLFLPEGQKLILLDTFIAVQRDVYVAVAVGPDIDVQQNRRSRPFYAHGTGCSYIAVEQRVILLREIECFCLFQIDSGVQPDVFHSAPGQSSAHLAFSAVPVPDRHIIEYKSFAVDGNRSVEIVRHIGVGDPEQDIVQPAVIAEQLEMAVFPVEYQVPADGSPELAEHRAQDRGEVGCIQMVKGGIDQQMVSLRVIFRLKVYVPHTLQVVPHGDVHRPLMVHHAAQFQGSQRTVSEGSTCSGEIHRQTRTVPDR